jgi:iron complex transport system substrate-binding protein
MKACSFLPAATSMIYQMGLQEDLCGVTFECHSDKPKVTRSILEGKQYTSAEIDRIVSESKAQGRSLYYIDKALLQELVPDVIFTQDVCDVCQIDTSYVQKAIYKLPKQPQLIPLIPQRLNDVFANAITIATTLNKEEVAYYLLQNVQNRINSITDTLRKHKTRVKEYSSWNGCSPSITRVIGCQI